MFDTLLSHIQDKVDLTDQQKTDLQPFFSVKKLKKKQYLLQERYVELDPEKTYITVCSHGLRSVKVESILKEKGFKKVYNGGAWSDLQKNIEKK